MRPTKPFFTWKLSCILTGMRCRQPLRSRFVVLISGLVVLAGRVGAAAEAEAANCRFESLTEPVPATGRLKQIRDGRSFLLEDGREVRLAGIELPGLAASAGDRVGQAAAQAAGSAL
jgi:endonuclease YncB( thermonuclease family)